MTVRPPDGNRDLLLHWNIILNDGGNVHVGDQRYCLWGLKARDFLEVEEDEGGERLYTCRTCDLSAVCNASAVHTPFICCAHHLPVTYNSSASRNVSHHLLSTSPESPAHGLLILMIFRRRHCCRSLSSRL